MAQQSTSVAPVGDLQSIDPAYVQVIISWLQRVDGTDANVTVDYTRPFVWPSLRRVYPLFVFLHACVMIVGSAGNVAMLVELYRRWDCTRRRRHRTNPMLLYLANLAASDLLKAAVVLPITVANLTIANWLYGSALCFLLPMMHSLPVHVSMLTHVAMAIDRYRVIVSAPMRSRAPACACVVGAWAVSGAAVLPYVVYVKYIDLGATLGARFAGVGLCCIHQQRHVQQYVRASFVIMYCLPLAVIAFLYVRVSVELKALANGGGDASRAPPPVSISLDSPSYQSSPTWPGDLLAGDASPESMTRYPTRRGSDAGTSDVSGRDVSGRRRGGGAGGGARHGRHRTHDDWDVVLDDDDEIDTRRETRTQRYLTFMVVVFALCWCPTNVLMLVTHFVYENPNNSGHFDVTYLLLTLCGYASTCVNAPVFASWRMSQHTRDRLRGYLRFSNRASLASNVSAHVHAVDDTRGNTLSVPTRFTNL